MSTEVAESDSSSAIQSEHGNEQSDNNCDSDYQSEDENDDQETDMQQSEELNIAWTGYGKKRPVLLFRSEAVLQGKSDYKIVGERYQLSFKFGTSESRIVRSVLTAHGFHEVHPTSPDFNVMWTGGHIKPSVLKSMMEFQKINHFPRSYELTRKDRLYKNVQRMQHIKGFKNFNFLPQSFIMPADYSEFCAAFPKERGPWIIKPVASSRGRGVYLASHPDQIPLDDNVIVSKYIKNPLLIDGFKFDVRLYVTVTSYDPLVIYLYEEGLTRFATVKYEKSSRSLRNQCMHLTNYSVNKKHGNYVRNDDPQIENYGNKWSLGALLRYLKSQKKDTAGLMMQIEDVVVKTILSAELHIASASKMFVSCKGNCFELYGFDILVDDTLKPWILEVNLSPSLVCDSPLDSKIKANLICDLFSLIGIVCHDPTVRNFQMNRKSLEMTAKMATTTKKRPLSAGSSQSVNIVKKSLSGLNSEEIKIVRQVKEEELRKGGWIRLFPSPDSWDFYAPYLQFSTNHNLMLHQRLYPNRHKAMLVKSAIPLTSAGTRIRLAYTNLNQSISNICQHADEVSESYLQASVRASQYERRLESRNKKKKMKRCGPNTQDKQKKTSSNLFEDGNPLNHDTQGKDCSLLQPKGTLPSGGTEYGEDDRASSEEQSHQQKSFITDFEDLSLGAKQNTFQKCSISEMIQNVDKMSILQARAAFSLYLSKVQHRLLSNCEFSGQQDMDVLNDHLDLVLRFLKKAACNFPVVVPSAKLSLKDRTRILASELGDFIQYYNKETRIMKDECKEQTEGLNSKNFNRFLRTADESQLEMFLTSFAKLRKYANIFLDTTKMDSDRGNSSSTEKNSAAEVICNKKLKSQLHDKHEREKLDSDKMFLSTSSNGFTESGSGSHLNQTKNVYTQQIAHTRPSSAITSRTTSKTVFSRPLSGSGSTSAVKPISEIPVDTYNDKAIREALQRLAKKRQAHQYSAIRVTQLHNSKSNLVTKGNNLLEGSTTDSGDSVVKVQPRICNFSLEGNNFLDKKTAVIDALNAKYKPTFAYSHAEGLGAGSVHDKLNISVCHQDLASFYSQLTGVAPKRYRSASVGSRQYQLVQQQQKMRFYNQSEALLEHNKVMHETMVAEAHAAHRLLYQQHQHQQQMMLLSGAPSQMYLPKPPVFIRKNTTLQDTNNRSQTLKLIHLQ